MKHMTFKIGTVLCAASLTLASYGGALASSHMDAPLITFDDPANTRPDSRNGLRP